jgi:hypothetical protein
MSNYRWTINLLTSMIYILTILGVTTYLVFWEGAYGAWYILAVFLIMITNFPED